MLLNLGKCKCLHTADTGQWNLNVNYKMGDIVLSINVKEKDLGIIISAATIFKRSVALQLQRVIKFLGVIRSIITYKEKS